MKTKKSLKQIFFKGMWPYWLGAIIIGVFNIALAVIWKPWSITGGYTNWGMQIWDALGGHPEKLDYYFKVVDSSYPGNDLLFNELNVTIAGTFFGVLLAVVMASQFRIKWIKSGTQLVLGITGGFIMGYGARLALGCNIGGLIGGVGSQSLHGWLFLFFAFFGSYAGALLVKKIWA